MDTEPEKPWQQKLKTGASNLGQNYKRRKITHLHKLFRNKGLGFYGIGYICTLLFLEVKTFIGEIADFTFSVDNLLSELIAHIISFSIDTLVNILKATIWPAILLGELPKGFGVALIAGAFLLYYLADKKWHFQQMYRDRFSVDDVSPILELWQRQQTDNFSELTDLAQPEQSTAPDFSPLVAQANNQQLENWRHYPESCFALVLLLNAQDNKNDDYCLEVIEDAIADKLDKELSLQQRCYFYLPLHLSPKIKHQKLSSKLYKKLRKRLSKQQHQQLAVLLDHR